MFVRSQRLNHIFSALFLVGMGACGNFGGCGACGSVSQLPPGGLPANQTVEGGAQIRITESGFEKLTSVLPGLVNQSLGAGLCIRNDSADVSLIGIPLASAEWCNVNSGPSCTDGCLVDVDMNTLGAEVVAQDTLRVNLSTSIATTIHIDFTWLVIFSDSCDLGISSNDLNGSFDIGFGIKPADGELEMHLVGVNRFDLNLTFTGCGILSSFGNLVADLLDSIPDGIFDLLAPALDPLVQNLLPDPLGVKGMADVGALLEGLSPGTTALMEARVVPGGYVSLDAQNKGMSVGVITGMNADEDIATRTGTRPDGVAYASEPNLCVPPIAAPAFGNPPHNLPITSRSTFGLLPAGAFNGLPDPQTDLAMGLSETMLDLAGHHLVTSGAMCMGIGTSTIEQLNVGTIGILVPSLAELTSDTGKDPLLLVTRPQKALDFAIGDNTATSPALTIGFYNLEVDFYAFLYERYVRAFTLDLTMNVGINLDFEMQGNDTFIKPMLSGISASTVTVKALNTEFVAETPQHLEMVLPSVFNLVTPLLGNIPPIKVPTFVGFQLQPTSITKVTTSQDDFLALYATIGAGAMMRQLGEYDPFAAAAVAKLDRDLPPATTAAVGNSKLRSVTTPLPEKVRASLLKQEGGAMPYVTFDVDRFDAQGRPLEWSYNLNGGLWHPYSSETLGGFMVRDPAFAWQGKYDIGLRARVKGDFRSAGSETVTPVIIDSVGPKIAAKKVQWDEDTMQVPLWDIVSEHHVQYAFGKPGDEAPSSPWRKGGMAELTRDELEQYVVDQELVVFAKDEAGNMTIANVAPFHGTPNSAGCASCEASGGPSPGGIALALFVGFVLVTRRRGKRILVLVRTTRVGRFATTMVVWLGASTAISLAPGCSCGDPGAKSCEVASDCGPDFCPEGQLPFCIDNTCVCSDDIVPGRVGPYSDVATGKDGSIWVSAYAQTHGDLVVARAVPGRIPVEDWEWVDGVPEGPVLIPDSKIRGGIDAAGPDVGMYTSIAVNNSGEPMVTYFDRDGGSLKFAARVGDAWQVHAVQTGTGSTLGENGELIGMYSSLTLRGDDGRPGVAYLVHIRDAQGARAEVRYAAAQVPVPTSSGDWQVWTVDSAPLPPDDPENPNIYPLPEGLGLFVDSARMPNQAPVIVYYDRTNGDLKLSKFNPNTGTFSAARVLDGTNVDAGWAPSVAVDANGTVHVAYVGSTFDDLKYITDAQNSVPQIVDDGYRIVGTTVDGLPKPEFHFVGEDAALVIANGVPMIAYQDATTQELLLATRGQNGQWTRISIAGATDPWPGAYGFFASSGLLAQDLVMSTWVINQPAETVFDNNWVEVFSRPTTIQ